MNTIKNFIITLNLKGSHYCCIISGVRKNELINVLQIADLTENSGTL